MNRLLEKIIIRKSIGTGHILYIFVQHKRMTEATYFQ